MAAKQDREPTRLQVILQLRRITARAQSLTRRHRLFEDLVMAKLDNLEVRLVLNEYKKTDGRDASPRDGNLIDMRESIIGDVDYFYANHANDKDLVQIEF